MCETILFNIPQFSAEPVCADVFSLAECPRAATSAPAICLPEIYHIRALIDNAFFPHAEIRQSPAETLTRADCRTLRTYSARPGNSPTVLMGIRSEPGTASTSGRFPTGRMHL